MDIFKSKMSSEIEMQIREFTRSDWKKGCYFAHCIQDHNVLSRCCSRYNLNNILNLHRNYLNKQKQVSMWI